MTAVTNMASNTGAVEVALGSAAGHARLAGAGTAGSAVAPALASGCGAGSS